MNQFSKWKMVLAAWFGTLLFVFLAGVVFMATISAEAKVAVVMSLVTIFGSIIFAYWRKTSAEEKVNPDSELPKANGQVVTPSTPVASPDGTVSPNGETDEVTSVTETVTPFDIEAFMVEIDRTTLARYGVVNFSTTFYNAETVLSGWTFDNNDAVDTANKALLVLAGNAFKEIWGVSYEDAKKYLNDPKGCTTCGAQTCTFPDLKFKARQLGMGYYTALLDYERILDTIW